jgi:FlaA1/EpsC-like NDP-sugar epimerase
MILITGGAGSIGSEVARRLIADGEDVRVADINEESLWNLRAECPSAEYMLADCLHDAARILSGADAVVHCAACKHVDLCEQNPVMAHRVNLDATIAMLRESFPRRFVFLSTDKAIEPSSIMGYSKKIAEQETLRCGGNVVRFGNVIGTRGSLVPMVRRCAERGVPIPLTEPEMTRWMMPVSEAVELILEALRTPSKSRVFGPREPQAVQIGRFVELCRDELAPGAPIVRGGSRPGERLHEPMELRTGRIVWSNDPAYVMTDADMLHLIAEAAHV